MFTKTTLTALLAAALCFNTMAQSLDDPGNYMTAVSNTQNEMNQRYMQYMSTSAHGASARKQEKVRQQVLESITNTRYKITDLPLYKGDNGLRKASLDYVQLCYNVFNEDYNKIVNLEEIAEQSFDEMQAVMLLHEKTDEKLDEANKKMDAAYDAFATKNNVKVTEGKSELGDKLNTAGKVNKYLNNVYLVFFKCNWQDGQLTKANDTKKINDIEQARNALITYADEGLRTLDTTKAFGGDNSLINTCRMILKKYKRLGEEIVPKMNDYLLKQEAFTKMKKSFDAKGNRTKEEVDEFNKMVKEINAAVNSSNQAVNQSNAERKQINDSWNEAYKQFQNNHMPYYK